MMSPYGVRSSATALAVAGLLASAGPAHAAWNNVFQVTCNDCNKPRVSYAPPACNSCNAPPPCEGPQKKVEYQQRSFYEPITVMKPEKYLEPVEVRSKSYYWEPVTSYSYTSYYDPCTGCKQQVATPQTSFKLKEQCSTSMRYVEKLRMVPTQSQRLVTETVPVVTYYYPPTRSYSSPVEPPCPTQAQSPATGPRVDEFRSPPTVSPERTDNIPPPNIPTTPNSLPRTMPPQAKPVPGGVNARTTSRPTFASVRGEVVKADQVTPRAGAKLVFVNAENLDKREFATADSFGNFDVRLPSGDWYMYLGNGEGRAMFHKKITVGDEARDFTVVSR